MRQRNREEKKNRRTEWGSAPNPAGGFSPPRPLASDALEPTP